MTTSATASVTVQSKLLTAKQAADYLGISTRTLWTLTKAGKVKFVRFTRFLQYDRDDLDAFIERSKSGM